MCKDWIKRGKLIKSAREFKKFKQSDLAEAVGISVSAISSYELGNRRPNIDISKKICKILDIDITQFI